MIRAGTMRHQIEIQSQTESKGTMGEVVLTWSKTATVRASINPITGNEMFISDQIKNQVTHKIGMRSRALSPKDRLVFKGRIFDIFQILDFQEKGVNFVILANENFNDV